MQKLSAFIIALCFPGILFSQNINGLLFDATNSATRNPSAAFEINANTNTVGAPLYGGFLMPRVALTGSADVATIAGAEATGLMVYNDGTGGLSPAGFYYWTGSIWMQLATASGGTGYIQNQSAAVQNPGTFWIQGVGRVGDGTAALPGLSFNTSSNTGMYLPAANTLGLSTSGIERMRIAPAGSVSINTTSTPGTFNVNGTAVIGTGLTSRSALGLTISTSDAYAFAANTDIGDGHRSLSIINENGTANNIATLSMRVNPGGGANNQMLDMKLVNPNDGTSKLIYSFGPNGSFNDRFIFTSNGNMGIGTTTPRHLLHIESNDPRILAYDNQAAISAARPAWEFGPSAKNFVFRTSPDYVTFTDRVLIDENGNMGIGTTVPLAKLDVRPNNGTASIRLQSSADAYPRIYMGGTDVNVAFVINRLTASATQYFGEDADAGGFQFRGTGATRIGSLSGTGNRFVVADASGNLSATSSTASGIVTGTGTSNYLARWTGTNTLANGVTQDDGTNVGIGIAPGTYKLNVNGSLNAEGNIWLGADAATSPKLYLSSSTGMHQIGLESWWTVFRSHTNEGWVFEDDGGEDQMLYAADDYLYIKDNTGIGISPPTTNMKLDVNGSMLARKYIVQDQVNGTNARGIWMWDESDSNWGIYMGTSGGGLSLANGTATTGAGGATSHSIRIRTYNDANNAFIYENSAEQLNFSVRASDGMGYFRGSVGIGTTSPGDDLHVRTSNYRISAENSADADGLASVWGTFSTIGQARNPGFGWGGGTLGLSNNMNSDFSFFGLTGTNDNSNAIINWGDDNDLVFAFNATERMRLTGGGSLGIGISPNARLDVSTGSDGIAMGQIHGDNTNTIQTYIDGQYASRATYSGGCCNALLLQPDVGTIGIGTTAPAATRLDIRGPGQNVVTIAASGSFYNDWPGGWGGGIQSWDLCLASIRLTGTSTRSDIRLKKDIYNLQESTNAIEVINKLRPVTYHWIDERLPKNLRYGFIAQEINEVLPELIEIGTDSMQTMGVNYMDIIPILTQAIKDQQKEIEQLKSTNRIADENMQLKTEVDQLKKMMLELEAKLENK